MSPLSSDAADFDVALLAGDGDMTGLTQMRGASTPMLSGQDGYAMGDLIDYAIYAYGVVTGTFTNGRSLTLAQLTDLDAAHGFTSSGNSEILHEWLLRAIEHKYEPAYDALERFLLRQGRRKFLKPLYQKLAETPEGLDRARRIYAKARPMYHSVSYRTIDQILKWG